ncbi:MAG: PQQ-dependent sugar dehydrogenase [Deltaproteobacteria bacterium]|nr:MAG: PQQ-dependent sugar dehydrogenase [Deltaproteobacteria bacterium]
MRLPVTLLTLLALVQPVRAGTPEPGFSDTLYADGLSEPTALAFLPDGRLLITQKSGELLLLDSGSTSTLVTIPVCTDSEMGLLGIALDPAFGSNGFIYLYRTHQGSSPPCGGSGRVGEVVRVTMGPGDTVSTTSVAVAPGATAPWSRTPITCGTSITVGCPSIAASASMPPTPQPTTPRPFTIVVCESVPRTVSTT